MAGAVLPGLAQESRSSNGGDGLPKRTKSGPGQETTTTSVQETDWAPSSLEQRRLQLRLTDSGKDPVARSDVAYAALLMNDHDLGIRTLGQSLIDSRTSADLVAILGPAVTKATEVRMRAQGWRTRRIATGDGDVDDEVCDMDSASGSVSALLFFCSGSLSCWLVFFEQGGSLLLVLLRSPLEVTFPLLRSRFLSPQPGAWRGWYVGSGVVFYGVQPEHRHYYEVACLDRNSHHG